MKLRGLTLLFLVTLSACATMGDRGPSLRYADAASRGAWASLLAGRPSQRQVDRATEEWSRALGDSFSCGVPLGYTLNAAVAGALEIGAMNAAATGGGERETREGVARYIATIVTIARTRREMPSQERCEAMAAWAPRVANEASETVSRAQRNGLMGSVSDLFMGLMGN